MSYTYSSTFSYDWDTWAVSVDAMAGNGYFAFTVPGVAGVVCGIAPEGIGEHYSSIVHGFYIEGSEYRVIESGTPITALAPFIAGARFRVERYDAQARYYINDVLVHTSTMLFQTSARLYACLYGYNDSILDPELVLLGSEATASGDLPAFGSFATADDLCFSISSLPAVTGSGQDMDGCWAESNLAALASHAETDELVAAASGLPAIIGFAEQSELIPNILVSHTELPGLQSFGVAEDCLVLISDMPGMQTVGVAVSGGESTDVAGVYSGLPALDEYSAIGNELFLVVEIPNIAFKQFRVAPSMYGKIGAFGGRLEGTSESAEVSGQLARLRGQMDAGGSLFAQMPELQGVMEGSVTSSGAITAQLLVLSGAMFTGASLDGDLFVLAGEATGGTESAGTMTGALSTLKGSLSAFQDFSADIVGAPLSIQGAMAATTSVSGQISQRAFFLDGHMTGSLPVDAQLLGRVMQLLGAAHGSVVAQGDIQAQAFILYGALRCAPVTSGSAVQMRYVRR